MNVPPVRCAGLWGSFPVAIVLSLGEGGVRSWENEKQPVLATRPGISTRTKGPGEGVGVALQPSWVQHGKP